MREPKQLELNVNAFLGLTDWMDAAAVQPITNGWYDVRFKMSEEERAIRGIVLERRWWDGESKSFSWAVEVGGPMSEEEIASRKALKRKGDDADLEWRGLLNPHPDLSRSRVRFSDQFDWIVE